MVSEPERAGGLSMKIDAQLCGSASDPVRVYFHLLTGATKSYRPWTGTEGQRPQAPVRTRPAPMSVGAGKAAGRDRGLKPPRG